MSSMMELLRAIYPLALAPVSRGADRCIEILNAELPGTVHEFEAGAEHNGWVLPQRWGVQRAYIRKDGQLIYDGTRHPLGVIGYSQPFRGRVPLAELRRHLFHHPRLDDALVYHCDMYYKPWRKEWGFSAPRRLMESLPDGAYDVDLETTFEPGTMKVYTHDVPGETDDVIVLNAHNCHAGQANDDIAGVVVGVEVLKRLAARRNRYSYRLVIGPEHLGTVFYLARLPAEARRRFRFGIFLEMLGNDNRMALQESFGGRADIDRAAQLYLRHHSPGFESFPFRRFVGNDETVWEAPGIEVPMIELCRYPYPQYHSDQDTDAIVVQQRLDESVETVLGILDILETNCTVQRRFDGLLALSNPRFDLYHPAEDPSLGNKVTARGAEWNHFMNCVIRYFDGKVSLLDMAERHGLPYHDVYAYIRRFHDLGLVDLPLPPWARPGATGR